MNLLFQMGLSVVRNTKGSISHVLGRRLIKFHAHAGCFEFLGKVLDFGKESGESRASLVRVSCGLALQGWEQDSTVCLP